jgi:hypothetical protein
LLYESYTYIYNKTALLAAAVLPFQLNILSRELCCLDDPILTSAPHEGSADRLVLQLMETDTH